MTNPDGFYPGRSRVRDGFPPSPVCWPALTIEEHGEQLADLTDWVDWMTERYRLDHRTIPPCWPEHGDLVEELSALRTAWQYAYAHTARGDAPLDWHGGFAASRQRLADWVARAGCRAKEHRP